MNLILRAASGLLAGTVVSPPGRVSGRSEIFFRSPKIRWRAIPILPPSLAGHVLMTVLEESGHSAAGGANGSIWLFRDLPLVRISRNSNAPTYCFIEASFPMKDQASRSTGTC